MAAPETIHLLTDVKITKPRARAKPYEVQDDDGLAVVTRPSGGGSFTFRYSFGGASRNLTARRPAA
jgi:hypothetical protein